MDHIVLRVSIESANGAVSLGGASWTFCQFANGDKVSGVKSFSSKKGEKEFLRELRSLLLKAEKEVRFQIESL